MATLNFKGKSFVQNHHLSVKYHQLIPNKDKSLTDKISLNDNLIIHGDNLIALKALLPTYAGKVKCIYIDPKSAVSPEKAGFDARKPFVLKPLEHAMLQSLPAYFYATQIMQIAA